MPNKTPSEYVEGLRLVAWLKSQGLLFSHLPLSTWTPSFSQRMKNKASGVEPGVPDYMILTATKLIFIELKRRKGYKVSPAQLTWLERLNSLGIPAKLCRGAEEAIEFVKEHL
jgi:hypothetical protein